MHRTRQTEFVIYKKDSRPIEFWERRTKKGILSWHIFSSVHFSRLVVSDSLWPHGLQNARPPCPSPTWSLLKLMSTELVMPSNHLILCHPLLLPPSIFPSSRGFSGELFQILRDDAVKLLHSICQQIWKTQQWPQEWKSSVFIPIPKKGNAKECSNYHTIALISQ